ncbi:MAG: CPBP family intramembrane metalloprotease [Akkermansia sp.]|nr:CPBP family intramembrane metalloprotease [Akkermansia sp.]
MPPFYVQLVMILLAGSLLLSYGVYAFGRRSQPAVPFLANNPFPTVWDALYTAIFVTVFVGSLASTLPMSAGEEGPMQTLSARSLLLSMLLQTLLYVPMVVRFALLPKREGTGIGLGRGVRMVLASVGVILLFSCLLTALHVDTLIMQLTNCPEQQDVVQSMMDGNTAQRLVLAAAAIIMAPIGEEVCFRGFVYNILRQRAGVWAATLTTGVLFGAIHASLVQFLPLAFFGIVQCIIYERSKTLWVPMAVHAVFNSLSVLFILLMPYLPETVQHAL